MLNFKASNIRIFINDDFLSVDEIQNIISEKKTLEKKNEEQKKLIEKLLIEKDIALNSHTVNCDTNYTSRQNKEKKKKYYEDNKERIKQYYNDNKEKILQRQKDKRIKDKSN